MIYLLVFCIFFYASFAQNVVKNIVIPGNTGFTFTDLTDTHANIQALTGVKLPNDFQTYTFDNNDCDGSNQLDLNIVFVLDSTQSFTSAKIETMTIDDACIGNLWLKSYDNVTGNMSPLVFDALQTATISQITDTIYFDNITIQNCSPNIIVSDSVNIQVNNVNTNNNSYEENNANPFIFKITGATDKGLVTINDGEYMDTELGGIFLFESCNRIDITGSQFINNHSDKSGGPVSVSTSSGITITSALFKDNSAGSQSGGAISFLESSQVEIISTQFIGNTANLNGAAIIISEGSVFKVKNKCVFKSNTSNAGNGVIYLSGFSDIEFDDTVFEQNQVALNGGGITMNTCNTVTGTNLLFYQNKSKNGGGLYIQNSSDVTFTDGEFIENEVQDSGGSMNLSKITNTILTNILISRNLATMAAAIKQTSLDTFTYTNINVENNYATKDGGGLNDQSGVNAQIIDSRFYNNTSETTFAGGMYLKNSNNFNITNVGMIKNKCNINGGAMWLESSNNIIIKNVHFLENQATVNLGGAILNLGSNNITYDECIFEKGISYKSGGISFKSSLTNVLITNSKFIDNYSQSIGGALDIETSALNIINTIFENNIAEEGGGSIHVSKSASLNFIDCTFINNTAPIGGAVKLADGAQSTFEGCEIYGHTQNIETGGALYFINYDTIVLQNTIVRDNISIDKGGAIYSLNVKTIEFNGSEVKSNSVGMDTRDSIGGAMYFEDVENVKFISSTVSENMAYMKGGAAYYKKVQNLIIEDSTIESNSVYFDTNLSKENKGYGYFISMGGAFYFFTDILQGVDGEGVSYDIPQTVSIKNTQFIGNKASSGSSLFIYHSVDTEFEVKEMENVNMSDEYADVGIIRYLGGSPDKYESKLKQFNFNPSNNQLLISDQQVITKYIENERRYNQDTYEFELCLFGTSLREGGSTNCDKCHDYGICEGGYKDNYPKKEYWRFGPDSWNYIYCKTNPELCLGQDQCKKGYKGILCEECDYQNGYSRTATGTCDICPEGTVIAIIISLVFIGYIALIKMTSMKVMMRVQQNIIKKYLAKMWGKIIKYSNQSSPIFKIIIMHLQILYLIKPFNIEFPSFIQGFSTSLANPGTSIALPTICFDPIQTEKQEMNVRFDQSQLSILFSAVIWVTLLLLTFLTYIRNLRKNKQQLFTQLISVSIVFFITQQVGLIEENMKFLICRDIDGKKYTIVDTHVDCESDYYKNEVFVFNLISLLLLLLLIPGLLFYVIVKNRNNQKNYQVQLKFGYLFIEFKQRCFYWEFFTMFQKAVIALISIIFVEEMIMKSLLSVFVIAFYSTMCFIIQPFSFLQLNKLTQVSSFCQIVTLFASIMLYGLEGTDALGLLNFLCVSSIVGSNIVFLLYAINMVFPYLGTSVKVYIIYNYEKMPKLWVIKRLKATYDKKEKSKVQWGILTTHVKNFVRLLKDPDLKKFNKQILFYNNNNDEIINDLKTGNFKKMNRILFQNSEQEILKQPNLQLETLCNYFDMKRQLGLSFEENVIKHIEQQIITETSQMLNSQADQQNLISEDENNQYQNNHQQQTQQSQQRTNIPNRGATASGDYDIQQNSAVQNRNGNMSMNYNEQSNLQLVQNQSQNQYPPESLMQSPGNVQKGQDGTRGNERSIYFDQFDKDFELNLPNDEVDDKDIKLENQLVNVSHVVAQSPQVDYLKSRNESCINSQYNSHRKFNQGSKKEQQQSQD